MKNFFLVRNNDIYRFYIFPKYKRVKKRIVPKKKYNVEISYELLLEHDKNKK